MLLQTNSYLVPKEKRSEHARLLRRFRQTLARLGCDSFDVFEQVGNNWALNQTSGRYVQIMRFRDRRHQQAVQQAEQADPIARQQIGEFCELVNIPYQQQQGLFAVSYYTELWPTAPARIEESPAAPEPGTNSAAERGDNGHPAPAAADIDSSRQAPAIDQAQAAASAIDAAEISAEMILPPIQTDEQD